MNAALRPTRPAPIPPPGPGMGQPGQYPVLQLEDFRTAGRAGDMTDGMAGEAAGASAALIARLRAEARAEAEAMLHDQQAADLVAALRSHAEALATATQAREAADNRLRARFATLLHAMAAKLLPIGRDNRLIEALVAELTTPGGGGDATTVICCPDRLHPALRRACAAAGLPEPVLEPAPDCAIRTGAEITRIDLQALQDRLLQLIDDHSTGDH